MYSNKFKSLLGRSPETVLGKRSETAPGKRKFGRMMSDAIHQAGEKAGIQYDANQFCLRTKEKEPRILYLGHAYSEYCDASASQREAILRRFARGWLRNRKDLPRMFEDLHPDLLPLIRGRYYYELMVLRAQREGRPSAEYKYQVLAEYLGISLVYDLPESIMMIESDQQLKDWGVTFNQALDAAVKNLSEISQQQFDCPFPGVWVSPWRDNYDGARLLLPDLLEKHPVKGDFIALMPHRDMLILTGSEDEAGLGHMVGLAQQASDHPRPVSGIPIRRDGEQWVPFVPDEKHPHCDAFKWLRLQTLAAEYQDQTDVLQAIHDKAGEKLLVARFFALKDKESAAASSLCCWSEGQDTLLPRTDYIFFIRLDAQEEKDFLTMATWEQAQLVVGDLVTKVDMYPERYRVSSFPNKEQLAAFDQNRPKDVMLG